MKIINGIIQPGKKIGDLCIGSKKEDVIKKLDSDYKLWQREDGFCIYVFENFKLWFDICGNLVQIGVTKGFLGDYQTISIGSTMYDVKMKFGKYENDGDVYEIPNVKGLCFELEDVDNWDEFRAPIEWIFVYKD